MVYETNECMKNISPFRQVNRTVKTVDSYLFPVTNSDDLDLQTTSLLDLLNVSWFVKRQYHFAIYTFCQWKMCDKVA